MTDNLADPHGEPAMWIDSDDGTTEIAVHDFDPHSDRPIVLISHATGFHTHAYQPLIDRLRAVARPVGIDHRGHGYTAPDTASADLLAKSVDWANFGVDTATVAAHFAPEGGLVGFGHSMGGAALALAAAEHPNLFRQLVLFEPIAPSGFYTPDAGDDPGGSRLSAGARRRRQTFASRDEAQANYGSKPPLAVMHPSSLEGYVVHGFRDAPDGVELRCTPEFEAATFDAALDNGVWESLDRVTTPTIVVSGAVEDDQPSAWAAGIADRMPNARLVVFADQTHFGPFSHPDVIADIVAETL